MDNANPAVGRQIKKPLKNSISLIKYNRPAKNEKEILKPLICL